MKRTFLTARKKMRMRSKVSSPVSSHASVTHNCLCSQNASPFSSANGENPQDDEEKEQERMAKQFAKRARMNRILEAYEGDTEFSRSRLIDEDASMQIELKTMKVISCSFSFDMYFAAHTSSYPYPIYLRLLKPRNEHPFTQNLATFAVHYSNARRVIPTLEANRPKRRLISPLLHHEKGACLSL